MANIILKNNEVIWKCSNTMLSAIYEALIEIVKNKEIKHSTIICNFTEKLNQNIYGNGCICVDIADYLKNKDEIITFANVFKEAIEQIKNNFDWQKERYQHALELYNQLINFD